MAITVNTKNAEKALMRLYKKAPKAAVNVINEAATMIMSQARTTIMSGYSPPITDTGKLAASVGFGQGMSKYASDSLMVGGTGVFAIVGSNLPYAQAIEYGSPPHQVPQAALIDWAQRKFGKSEAETKTIAYFVGKKIAAEGTKARPFLIPAYEDVRKKLPKMVLKEMKRLKKKV
tara:strand:+ start:145 stop:669 length:525 start_codon:yes stop_codon:yes gene_type:complete